MAVRRRGASHRSQPNPLASRVGNRVRLLRQERGFTFDAFVEEVGLGRGYVSELERGLVVPSATALERLAGALEVTIADLVLGGTAREQLFEATRRLSAGEVAAVLSEVRRLGRAHDGGAAPPRSPPFRVVSQAQARTLATALPLLQLRPVAGAWSPPQGVGLQAWVLVPLRTPGKRGLFVAQVEGASMEPAVPARAYCLFHRPWASPRPGEVGVFARWEDDHTGSFTLKEYQPRLEDTEAGLVVSGALKARNPAFSGLRHRAGEEGGEHPFARLVRVVAVHEIML